MKIPVFFYSLIFLCAGFCCGGDDEDNEGINYTLAKEGLIEVEEGITNYAVGDTLWIHTTVPFVLPDRQGNPVNLVGASNNSDRLYVYLNLYQTSGFERPSPVLLSNREILVEKGEVSVSYGITATAFSEENFYESSFGIILKSPGSYFLGAAYLEEPWRMYVDTRNYNQIFIETTFLNASPDSDRYFFTVE